MLNDQNRTQHETAAVIETLRTRTLDALAGYDAMLPRADPSFRPTVQAFATLHARHAADLSLLVQRHGGNGGDGSLMGTVTRAVVAVRAVVDTIDTGILTRIAEGETHVLAAFDDALAARLTQAETADLRRMRADLADLLAHSLMPGRGLHRARPAPVAIPVEGRREKA